MIIKNITYKWLDMSDANARTNGFVIQEVTKNLALRTTIFDRETYHGSIASNTIASGRFFTFKWQIFGFTDSERWNGEQRLNNIIKPEWFLWESNRGFYDLAWKDDSDTQYKVSAKVYKMPEYERELWSPVINFTFELYAEESTYQSYNSKTEAGIFGNIGGNILPNLLPNELDGVFWSFPITNDGNFIAPCRIEINWPIQNPKLTNLSNGRFYGLTGITTTALVLDNTGKIFIVEDAGVNVSGYRLAWSKLCFLEPWINNFLLTWDNYNPSNPVTITVTFNDTYIHS